MRALSEQVEQMFKQIGYSINGTEHEPLMLSENGFVYFRAECSLGFLGESDAAQGLALQNYLHRSGVAYISFRHRSCKLVADDFLKLFPYFKDYFAYDDDAE